MSCFDWCACAPSFAPCGSGVEASTIKRTQQCILKAQLPPMVSLAHLMIDILPVNAAATKVPSNSVTKGIHRAEWSWWPPEVLQQSGVTSLNKCANPFKLGHFRPRTSRSTSQDILSLGIFCSLRVLVVSSHQAFAMLAVHSNVVFTLATQGCGVEAARSTSRILSSALCCS